MRIHPIVRYRYNLFNLARTRVGGRMVKRSRIALVLAVAMAVSMLISACGGSTPPGTGTGSTFDNPLFSKMFSVYPSVKCGINVNYQAVGSGAGINDLLQQIVAFGATDAPMSDTQLASSKAGPIIHIPVTLGAVAIVYNVPGVTTRIKLTGPIIAAIFLGTIKSWDDPQIKAVNTGVTLPHLTITVAHRSDGSGTTGIYTHYLAAVSPDWMS